MDLNSHKEFIKKSYNEYKKIGYVECPAFGGEKVYFNKKGFRHLIWKGTKAREVNEQSERLMLLKYAPLIIKTSKSFKDYNKNKVQDVDFGLLCKHITVLKLLLWLEK